MDGVSGGPCWVHNMLSYTDQRMGMGPLEAENLPEHFILPVFDECWELEASREARKMKDLRFICGCLSR